MIWIACIDPYAPLFEIVLFVGVIISFPTIALAASVLIRKWTG